MDDEIQPPSNLNALDWATAFAAADDGGTDVLAAWFAAAMEAGQQQPDAEIELDF